MTSVGIEPPNTNRSIPDRSYGANPVLAANPRISSYARNKIRNGSQSMTKLRPRPSAIAMRRRASTTHSGSIETPRHSITPKIRTRYAALPKRMRRDRCGAGRGSGFSDNHHRRDLHRDRERERAGTDGRACVLASVAEHLGDQIRRRVHHLGLIAEVVGRQHPSDQLHDLDHVVEADRGLHLRQYIESRGSRGVLRLLDAHLVRASAGETRAVTRRDLAGDEQQGPSFADRHEPRRNVRGSRRWRCWQRQAELTQAVVRGVAHSENVSGGGF